MEILLVFDEKFPVDREKLNNFFQKNAKYLKFELHNETVSLPERLITKPETFRDVLTKLKNVKDNFDKIFYFTTKQYNDNYFFHEYHSLIICSFYSWNYLTDLPISNGILYFVIDYLALEIDRTDFRHAEITGCIYDFLGDKKGVDAGMRQARFCPNCLKRISEALISENDLKLFDDLQLLMDLLSNASRWNTDIFTNEKPVTKSPLKRKHKSTDGIRVAIASPGDTNVERQLLLDTLEVRFRRDNHERHCGFRIIVDGWENLASQPGYPQQVINEQLIDKSDFVVAVFRHRLGTPTLNAESGTVEELLKALDITNEHHPIGMAYFFSQAPVVSLDNINKGKIEEEWNRLHEFKKLIKDKVIYKPYTDENELITIVLQDLEKNIQEYIINNGVRANGV